jgi:hypothetical protein
VVAPALFKVFVQPFGKSAPALVTPEVLPFWRVISEPQEFPPVMLWIFMTTFAPG